MKKRTDAVNDKRKSRCSTVDVVTGYSLDGRGARVVSREGQHFSHVLLAQTDSGSPSNLLSSGYAGRFRGMKWYGSKTNHWPPTCVEVRGSVCPLPVRLQGAMLIWLSARTHLPNTNNNSNNNNNTDTVALLELVDGTYVSSLLLNTSKFTAAPAGFRIDLQPPSPAKFFTIPDGGQDREIWYSQV
jgi:hypothetical protein